MREDAFLCHSNALHFNASRGLALFVNSTLLPFCASVQPQPWQVWAPDCAICQIGLGLEGRSRFRGLEVSKHVGIMGIEAEALLEPFRSFLGGSYNSNGTSNNSINQKKNKSNSNSNNNNERNVIIFKTVIE